MPLHIDKCVHLINFKFMYMFDDSGTDTCLNIMQVLSCSGIHHHKSTNKNTVEAYEALQCGLQTPCDLPTCGQHEAKEIAAFDVLEAGSVC